MKKLALLLGGVALLSACATNRPEAPAAAVAVDPNNPLFAPSYMAMAGSGDQFEIQSSQLALQMSQNPQIRSIAQMLITDHTRSTQMVVAAAQSAGITPPPPTLLPQHQALLDQIRSAGTGANFDAAYRDVQIQAHQQALALHQNYAAQGDVPALRTVAGQIALVVQNHLNALQSMQMMPPSPPAMTPPPPGRTGERG